MRILICLTLVKKKKIDFALIGELKAILRLAYCNLQINSSSHYGRVWAGVHGASLHYGLIGVRRDEHSYKKKAT